MQGQTILGHLVTDDIILDLQVINTRPALELEKSVSRKKG